MQNPINSVVRYLKYVFKGVVDNQLEKGRIERDEFIPKDKVTSEQKKQLLEGFIVKEVSKGWRLISQTENSVTLEYGKKPNHILHLLLSIVTLGFWLIVWLIMGLSMTVKRRTYAINDYGHIKIVN
jgi:hypothetical protein